MVAFNFQARFAEAVESGRKRQTIREKARCQVGDTLQLYTGMRTKQCRLLRRAVCIGVSPIKIGPHAMIVNATIINREPHLTLFAKRDGFGSFGEMAEWFAQQYGPAFHGFVIAWRPV